MARERIKELVDFATTESPYRNANKGWINDDVFVQFGASQDASASQGVELANVSIFWQPVNKLITTVFTVVLLATICVFCLVSLAHGKFEVPTTSSTVISESEKVVDSKEEPEEIKTVSSTGNSYSSVEILPEKLVEKPFTSSDFAAAALGGKKIQSKSQEKTN